MPRKLFGSISTKVLLAVLLAATAVVSSAGSMRCLVGLPFSACAKPEKPVKKDCCAPKTKAPKENKCCCIDALKKTPHENAQTATFEFRLDFPILVEALPSFEAPVTITEKPQRPRPNILGPPGPDRTPSSPRAPPVA